ncbi:MAG: hypothetical protein FJX35_07190 [Alphaproteobacteria bacterium]|nr:hypothetical protein [Alphaproteobacteria bacterium]
MAATTPDLPGIDKLTPLATRYVDIDRLPWRPTRWPGIRMKVLLEDKASGLTTLLMRWDPGAALPFHEHARIEQTYVLEGRLVDDEGEITAGNYAWRPQGSRHVARTPDGALMIAFFLEPNRFFDDEAPKVRRAPARRRRTPARPARPRAKSKRRT